MAHVVVVLVQDLQGHSVACLARVKNIPAGQVRQSAQGGSGLVLVQPQLGQPDNAGGGAILLHTAPLAAAAHGGLSGVQNHVAQLRAGTVGTVEEPSFHNDAAADTGAQGNEHDVLTALAAALPEFTQGSHIGIVAGLYGKPGQVTELFGNVEYAPAQIYAAVHRAGGIHGAGNADAQAQQRFIRDIVVLPVASHRCRDVGQDLLAAVCGYGGNFPLVQHITGFVKVGDLYGGAAKIHAKAIFHWGALLFVVSSIILQGVPKRKMGKRNFRKKAEAVALKPG